VIIPLITSKIGEFGLEEWIYTGQALAKSNDVIDTTKGEYALHIIGEKIYDPKLDFEIIYFLRHISSALRKGYINEFSEEKDASNFFNVDSRVIELKAAIGSIKEKDTVDALARAWGVPEPNLDEEYTVKKKLFDRVVYCEHHIESIGRGITEFLNEMSFGGDTIKNRIIVQKAFEQKYIVFDQEELAYYYGDGTKKIDRLLYRQLPGENIKGLDAVHSFLLENEQEMIDIKMMMQRGVSDDWTEDKIKALTWPEFRKVCPNYRVDGKREELQNEWIAELKKEIVN